MADNMVVRQVRQLTRYGAMDHVVPHPPVLVYDRHGTNLIIDGSIVDSTTLAQALRSAGGDGAFDNVMDISDDIDKYEILTIRNVSRVDQGVVDAMRKIIQRSISSSSTAATKATTVKEKESAEEATVETTAMSSLKPPPPPPPPPVAPPPAAPLNFSFFPSNELDDVYSIYGPPPQQYTQRKKDSNLKKKNDENDDDNKKKTKTKWEKIELIHSSGPSVSKLIEEMLPYTDGFAYTGSVPLHRMRYNLDDSCLKVIGNSLMVASTNDDTAHHRDTGNSTGGSSSRSRSTDYATAASAADSADTMKDETEERKMSPSSKISFLSLKGTRLRGNGFEVLCRGLASSTSLKRFELSHCSIEADDVGKLASGLRQNKHLTYLGFAGCKFGSTTSHVARRPSSAAEDHHHHQQQQEEVQQEVETEVAVPLDGLGQGQREVGQALHAAAHHPGAAGGEINVDIQIEIDDDRSSDAESIVLSTNNTNPQTHFSQVLESLAGGVTIETLKISGMYTNEACMNAIGSLLSSPNSALKFLGLKNNLPQHDGSIRVTPVLEALKHNKTLTNLQLAGNNINDEVVDELTTILAGPNKTLQGLILSSNSIGNDGIRSLARRLPDFESLKSLDLQRNRILDEDSKKSLFAALEKNVVMTRLDLDNGADPKKIWWLTLNKAGRALLTKDQDIPPGLWPKIIHRALTMVLGRARGITNLDVMHYFLRRGHEMFEHAVEEDGHKKQQQPKKDNQSPIIDHTQKKRKIDSIVKTSNTDNGNDTGQSDIETQNEKKPRQT